MSLMIERTGIVHVEVNPEVLDDPRVRDEMIPALLGRAAKKTHPKAKLVGEPEARKSNIFSPRQNYLVSQKFVARVPFFIPWLEKIPAYTKAQKYIRKNSKKWKWNAKVKTHRFLHRIGLK